MSAGRTHFGRSKIPSQLLVVLVSLTLRRLRCGTCPAWKRVERRLVAQSPQWSRRTVKTPVVPRHRAVFVVLAYGRELSAILRGSFKKRSNQNDVVFFLQRPLEKHVRVRFPVSGETDNDVRERCLGYRIPGTSTVCAVGDRRLLETAAKRTKKIVRFLSPPLPLPVF